MLNEVCLAGPLKYVTGYGHAPHHTQHLGIAVLTLFHSNTSKLIDIYHAKNKR